VVSPERVGDYEVLRELGRGGMGVVLEARDPQLKRSVAIKLLLASRFDSERARERFRLEAEALARLRHPCVVTVHANGVDRGRPYLVLDLVQGQTLAQRVEQGPLPPQQVIRLGIQLAEALEHAHQQGVVHRDVKPENVILTASGEPKLTDFGLARHLDAEVGPSKSGDLLGTPGYWAPEQLGGPRERIGAHTDVYGLGATLYTALAGEPPFDGESLVQLVQQTMSEEPRRPAAVNPQAGGELDDVLLRCLAKEPSERYARAGELAEALRAVQRGEGAGLKAWAWALALLAVVVAAGAAAVWRSGSRQAPPEHAGPEETPSASPDDVPAGDPLQACLAADIPDEAQIAAAEEALCALAEQGASLPLEALGALRPGAARWRLRTLGLLLAGQARPAADELAAAPGALPARLRQLVELALEAEGIVVEGPRRGFEIPPPEEAIAALAHLLERAEHLAAQHDDDRVRRWALERVQAGAARLVVLARDRVPSPDEAELAGWLPTGWERRARALVPDSPAVAPLRIAGGWARHNTPNRQRHVEALPEREAVLALLEAVGLPPLFEALACSLLNECLGGTTAERVALARRGVAAFGGDPELGLRYQRQLAALRQTLASAALLRAWARLQRGQRSERSRELLREAFEESYRATVWGQGRLSGIEQFTGDPPPLGVSGEGMRQALEAQFVSPSHVEHLVVILLLAGNLEAAEAVVQRIQRDSDLGLRRLLEAELMLLRGQTAEAEALLVTTTRDPALTSKQAWVALAHVLSLRGDAAGAERALARVGDASYDYAVPWHEPHYAEALLDGDAWWPGKR
jgi:hypothetical protein